MTRIRPFALAAALLLASAPLGAQAAAPAEVPAGARLRVYVRGAPGHYLVHLARAGADTLWVRPVDASAASVTGEFPVAVADLSRLRWLRGRRTHVLRNGGIGLGAGALVGAVLGAVHGASDDGAFIQFTPVEGAAFFGVLLGVPAGVVGALSGLVPTEQWSEVAVAPDAPATAHPAAVGPLIRPRLGLTRVPVRGGPAARALSVGVTVHPR
jgi:hypothetical protein